MPPLLRLQRPSSRASPLPLVPISTRLWLRRPAYHLDFKLQAVQVFQASCPSQASRDFPRTPHSHPCRNCSIMQLHSQHCYSRSTQRQLWKATQLSQMGFLVTLQHQEHHFLCSQACPRVGGSEYILTHILLQSNVRIARGPQ